MKYFCPNCRLPASACKCAPLPPWVSSPAPLLTATEASEMSIGERYARRMCPVSRDELVNACMAVRSRFGGNGTELSDAIADAFAELAKELT